MHAFGSGKAGLLSNIVFEISGSFRSVFKGISIKIEFNIAESVCSVSVHGRDDKLLVDFWITNLYCTK